jgi:hypothetical protein
VILEGASRIDRRLPPPDRAPDLDEEKQAVYAVVTRYRFHLPLTEDQRHLINTDVLEGVFRQTPGFQVFYGVQVSAQELMAISLWENQGAADNAFRRAAPALGRILGNVMAGRSERTQGEVVVQMAPPMQPPAG